MELLHDAEEDLKCRRCKHVSADKTNYRLHQVLNHAFTKVYKCFMCDYSVALKSSIISHALDEHYSLENYENIPPPPPPRRRPKRQSYVTKEEMKEEPYEMGHNDFGDEDPMQYLGAGGALEQSYEESDYGVDEAAALMDEEAKNEDEAEEEEENPLEEEGKQEVEKFKPEEFINRDGVRRKLRAMCELCGKKFEFGSYLKKHMNAVHLKLKPHSCPHCDKSFSKKDYLNGHLELVHDIRAYKPGRTKMCEDCGKAFFSRQALEIHRNGVHLKIHKYKCDSCDYGTAQPGHIKRHMTKSCPVKYPEMAKYQRKKDGSGPKGKRKKKTENEAEGPPLEVLGHQQL